MAQPYSAIPQGGLYNILEALPQGLLYRYKKYLILVAKIIKYHLIMVNVTYGQDKK